MAQETRTNPNNPNAFKSSKIYDSEQKSAQNKLEISSNQMKQRDKDSERQIFRGTEKRGSRGADATDEMDEKPPLAASVKTLPEAVQLSLKDGFREDCLFVYARALKAFEITTGIKLQPSELDTAFCLWWQTASTSKFLPAEADLDEYRFEFGDAFAKAKSPLGSNPLVEAIRRADTNPLPLIASRYNNPKIRRLVGVCFQLQRLAGDNPFFLSFRSAAKVIDKKTLNSASQCMNGLVRDGILSITTKGTPGGRRATRFRFHEVPKSTTTIR